MIRPPGWDGVAFTDASDGDMRSDPQAREAVSSSLGIDSDWARVHQVHGDMVIRVDASGDAGEADAVWTAERELPLAIFTADCFGVVLLAPGAVGVAHAGWRGARTEIVAKLRAAMEKAGHPPQRAAFGPGIEPCCFEVGPEVAEGFPAHTDTTDWGTVSVDLPAALSDQVDGLSTWRSGRCTKHEQGLYSHRGDQTPARQASLGWLT